MRQVHACARVPAARAARARAAVPGARAHARRSGAEVRLCLSAGHSALGCGSVALRCKMLRGVARWYAAATWLCGAWRSDSAALGAGLVGAARRPLPPQRQAAQPEPLRRGGCVGLLSTAGRAHGVAVDRMRRHFWLRSLMELARASSRSEEPPALQCLREARRGGAWLHAAALRCARPLHVCERLSCAGAPVGAVRAAAARRGSDWHGRALRVPAAGLYRLYKPIHAWCIISGRPVRSPPRLRRQPQPQPRTHACSRDRLSCRSRSPFAAPPPL